MQAVVEVFAEAAFADFHQRVAVGRADEADVDLFLLGAADLGKGPGLDETQQFGLQVQVHLADFIEEQGAAIGLRRCAFVVADRTGKGAFDVPEDFGLHQVFGNGGAVEHDERLLAARGHAVNGLGRDFLAGAGLAGDEGGRLRRRGRFHHAVDDLHGLGFADEALKALGRDRLGGGDHLLLDGLALERGFDGLYQPLAVEGLDQKVVGPAAHGLDRHVDRAVGGDHDHGSLQAAFLDEVEDFSAAHIGQAHVEQDQVRLVGGELIEGFLATAGVGDVERLVLEVLFVQRNQRLFVFDE